MVQVIDPIMIRDVPVEERPRERMIELGERQLTNPELVALILRTGSVQESVLGLADRVLHEFGGFHGLADASVEEIRKVPGMGTAKACELKAAVEIGRRMAVLRPERPTVRSPRDLESLLFSELSSLTQEHFVVLPLDSKNKLIGLDTVHKGTLNSSLVHPREVFKAVIRRSANSFLVAHNHPSGDPHPSKEDIEVTRRLHDGSKLLGIEFLDHLIVGDGRLVSLRERGLL